MTNNVCDRSAKTDRFQRVMRIYVIGLYIALFSALIATKFPFPATADRFFTYLVFIFLHPNLIAHLLAILMTRFEDHSFVLFQTVYFLTVTPFITAFLYYAEKQFDRKRFFLAGSAVFYAGIVGLITSLNNFTYVMHDHLYW